MAEEVNTSLKCNQLNVDKESEGEAAAAPKGLTEQTHTFSTTKGTSTCKLTSGELRDSERNVISTGVAANSGENQGMKNLEKHISKMIDNGNDANNSEVSNFSNPKTILADESSINPEIPSANVSLEHSASKDMKLDELPSVNTKSQIQMPSAEERENPDGSTSEDYELIGNHYYYTDKTSGHKYKYDAESNEWVASDGERRSNKFSDNEHVTTDNEGRSYYYAGKFYLCQDPQGNVFYWNEKHEWQPWTEKVASDEKLSSEEKSKWYFYQGDSTFYRDNSSNTVYKLNKETNEWEVFEGKLKTKRPRTNEDEEFDTDEDEDSDDEFGGNMAPPGVNSDPSISYDGQTYTKVDASDNMLYEWDSNRRAWFPKVYTSVLWLTVSFICLNVLCLSILRP